MLTEFNVAEFAAKHAILTMELKDALHRTLGTGGGCEFAYKRFAGYLGCLQSAGLWLRSYAYIIQQRQHCLLRYFIVRVSEPYHQEYCRQGKGCSECNKYRHFSFGEEFDKEKEEVIKGPIGLCIDCVSIGRESFRTNQCRIKHAV